MLLPSSIQKIIFLVRNDSTYATRLEGVSTRIYNSLWFYTVRPLVASLPNTRSAKILHHRQFGKQRDPVTMRGLEYRQLVIEARGGSTDFHVL
jgi:hypothetical protein